jgi:hypothetical protein
VHISSFALLTILVATPAEMWGANSQPIVLPAHLAGVHPRISARPGNSQTEIRALVDSDAAAKAAVDRARAELATYLDHFRQDPMWVASRLQMYWKSHATDVYNRGDVFDHVDGHAPVATVRYPGSRDPVSVYRAPKLEDIPPYEDDTHGVYLVNTSEPGQPLEWTTPSKSGRVIDGINANILRMAQTAAQLAWITGDEEYARFAFTIFDTYMRGMYYRNEPIDLSHGHSQNIYGMSTFEVIQEGVLTSLATTYDFLYNYIEKNHSDALPIYADTFRKWIGVTIGNGVPFNNWDLIEARFITAVALVLENDSAYADHRGAQYFLNQVLNEDSVRQWSLRKLAASGFDPETGIWFESPDYSMNVVNDFISLFNQLDVALGTDLLEDIPIVRKAADAMAQYAFPNGLTVSWGDSHYGPISTMVARQMVVNARLHHRREQEVHFTGLARLLDELNQKAGLPAPGRGDFRAWGRGLDALFDRDSFKLDASIPALKISDVLTAAFSATSASYFVQRNGLDPQTGLMISEAGSLGNHQHANGVTIELYGLGLPLAPDSGIGTNYFQADQNEYYAQFPAHNTVVVDGISSYPTMMSHHGFTVNSSFPLSSDTTGIELPVTFADVSFLEPETNADQRRVTSIVRTSPETGYYVDIFRSRRRDGHDKKHDYFFHGLGQAIDVAGSNGEVLTQTPTQKLTFADEELNAYDYLWQKYAVAAAPGYRAIYHLQIPNRPEIQLTLWIAGAQGRQIYNVLAPPARSIMGIVPQQIANLPLHTLVVRQTGEAWNRPFVSVIEPSSADRAPTVKAVHVLSLPGVPVDAVALRVDGADGGHQIILSATSAEQVLHAEDAAMQGGYAVMDRSANSESVFLGDGTWASLGDFKLELSGGPGSAFVRRSGTQFSLQMTRSGRLTIPAAGGAWVLRVGVTSIPAKSIRRNGRNLLVFSLPGMPLSEAELVHP